MTHIINPEFFVRHSVPPCLSPVVAGRHLAWRRRERNMDLEAEIAQQMAVIRYLGRRLLEAMDEHDALVEKREERDWPAQAA
tara:strand:+ start:295 stop:540 length:246 start_codon:yes stop_codon:yes gene_type:complete